MKKKSNSITWSVLHVDWRDWFGFLSSSGLRMIKNIERSSLFIICFCKLNSSDRLCECLSLSLSPPPPPLSPLLSLSPFSLSYTHTHTHARDSTCYKESASGTKTREDMQHAMRPLLTKGYILVKRLILFFYISSS